MNPVFHEARTSPSKSITQSRWPIMLLCCLFPIPLQAQSSKSVVPDDREVYVWTDDFPQIIDDLLEASALDDDAFASVMTAQLDAVWASIEQDQGEDRIPPAMMEELTSLLLAVIRDDLFDSSMMLMRRTAEDGQRHWSLIGHTEADADEIDVHLASIERLNAFAEGTLDEASANSPCLENANDNDPDSIFQLKYGLGFWCLEDDWFVWALNRNEVTRLRDSVAHHENALRDNRSFRRTMGALNERSIEASSIEFYFSGDFLPELAAALGPSVNRHVASLSDFSDPDVWRFLSLTELRGLGGRLRIESDLEVNDVPVKASLDSVLLITSPRQGVYSAIRHQAGPDLNIPIGDVQLDRFSLFELDGDIIAEEGAKLLASHEQSADETENHEFGDRDVVGYYRQLEIQRDFVRSITGVCEYTYWLANAENVPTRTRLQVAIQIANLAHVELLDRFVELRTRGIRMENSERSTERIEDRGSFRWKYLDRVIDDYVSFFLDWNQRAAEFAQQRFRDSQENDETKRSQLAEAEARIQASNRVVATRAAWMRIAERVLCDGWFFERELSSDIVESMIARTEPNQQLANLAGIVEDLEREFSIHKTCGVVAFWNEMTRAQHQADNSSGGSSPSPDPEKSELSPESTETAKLVGFREALLTRLRRHLESQVAGANAVWLLSEHRSGFRITGIASQNEIQDIPDDQSR